MIVEKDGVKNRENGRKKLVEHCFFFYFEKKTSSPETGSKTQKQNESNYFCFPISLFSKDFVSKDFVSLKISSLAEAGISFSSPDCRWRRRRRRPIRVGTVERSRTRAASVWPPLVATPSGALDHRHLCGYRSAPIVSICPTDRHVPVRVSFP